MFGLGFGEMVVIALLAIIVVGPTRLPTLFKTVGGAMRQLRQASRDIRTSVGFDELMDLDAQPKRPVARVRPPVDAAPVANTSPVAASEPAPAEVVSVPPTNGDGTPTASQ